MKRFYATLLLLLWSIMAFAVEKSPTIVYINGSKFYIHTVQPGETVYALSKAYGVGENVITGNNPAAKAGLKAGENIKIPFIAAAAEEVPDKKLRKAYDFHPVKQGETLYAISRLYEIPVPTIIEDNPDIDPAHLKPEQRILIRKKEIGSEDESGSKQQWEEYRRSLNSVAEAGYAYYIVHPGETFYSLSRRYGITEDALGKLNGGLQAADLKAGAIIKVPAAGDTDTVIVQNTAPEPQEQTQTDITSAENVREIEFTPLRPGTTLNVALLLPFAADGGTNTNYVEFYQGFLLGLDAVKMQNGISINLEVYNTARNEDKVREITQDPAFRNADLIVGPVYEEALGPVLLFAEDKGIPVVSPLANITKANSDVLFQLAPDPARKWEKAADLINGSRRITLIYGDKTDKEFESEILTMLGASQYRKHTYKYVHSSYARGANSPANLQPLLDNSDDNVFIILSDDKVEVDRILEALSSANTGLTSRRGVAPRFVVLGNTRWNRYDNIDREKFFKNHVIFISSYHAKRDSQTIVDFDNVYIRTFRALPTLFSYRGYDAAVVFAPAMYGDIESDMEGTKYTPLQTSYIFGQGADRNNHVNRNWMRVNYNTDFTITVE